MRAGPGSTHGYDILDHSTISPALDGETGSRPSRLADRHVVRQDVKHDDGRLVIERGPIVISLTLGEGELRLDPPDQLLLSCGGARREGDRLVLPALAVAIGRRAREVR